MKFPNKITSKVVQSIAAFKSLVLIGQIYIHVLGFKNIFCDVHLLVHRLGVYELYLLSFSSVLCIIY